MSERKMEWGGGRFMLKYPFIFCHEGVGYRPGYNMIDVQWELWEWMYSVFRQSTRPCYSHTGLYGTGRLAALATQYSAL